MFQVAQMTGEELNKTHTKFRFFRPSPDESTVGVVYSFPAGTEAGAKPDKTRPFLDGFKKVSVGKAKMGTMPPMIRNHAKIWKANRAIWGCNHHSAGIYGTDNGLSFAWCAWCAKNLTPLLRKAPLR